MARTQTMVQLTDDLLVALDAEAARRGVSRSALIREILAADLGDASERAVTRQIVEAYERIPPATPDEWGRLDELVEHSTRETLQRLDAEEGRQGEGEW